MCWIWHTWILLSFLLSGGLASKAEYNLIEKMTATYNSNVRPVLNSSEPLRVSLDIALNQIVNMDEKYQILVSMVWLRLYWRDEHLQWNESDFNGINEIRLKPVQVWVPDVTLYNDAGDKGMKSILNYNVRYTSSGSASWLAPILLTSSCTLELSAFPFDKQKCKLTLSSWTFHGFDLDLQNHTPRGDISTFNSNGEWSVEDMPVERHVKYYNCCKEPYPSLTYTIVMRRLSLFYSFNLMLPCVVITAITAVGFYLPPDSGEKCSLMITIMLSLTVFLLMVAESMPPSSEAIPLIGWYFALSIILVAVSTTVTVLIIATHHKGSHNNVVPQWVRKLVLCYLATLIGRRKMVTDCGFGTSAKVHAHTNKKLEQELDFSDNGCTVSNIRMSRANLEDALRTPVKGVNAKTTNRLLEKIADHTRTLSDMAEATEASDRIKEEWQMVAIVLDRFCFYVFGVIVVTMGVCMFVYTP